MNKDKIFVIGFGKSGKTSDGYPSDFIASYEKVPGNSRFLRLVAHRTSVESDKKLPNLKSKMTVFRSKFG